MRLLSQGNEEADPRPARGLPALVRGFLGRNERPSKYAVNIPDIALRGIGHVSPPPPNALHMREEFRAIKRHVLSHLESGKGRAGFDPRVIVVLSARPGEGKTFVALNLALSLCISRGQGVTLIDGNILNGGLSRQFGLDSANGLIDALDDPSADVSEFVETSNIGNFRMMPVGYNHPDSVELLTGARMSALIGKFLSESPNELVVIDTPSILSGSAALAIAAHAGQMVFVISSNESHRGEVEECFGVLDTSVGPIDDTNIGLVLNKINPAHSIARYSAT